MANPLFVATADWHVKEHTWADRPGLRGDAIYALAQIVSFAVKKRIPVLAAGDLLDSKRNEAFPIHAVRIQIERLAEADVPLYFIQGQHELQERPWLNALHKWPTWWGDDLCLRIGTHRVWGLEWTPPDQLEKRLGDIPEETAVVMVHQVCHHWMGGITSPELDFAMVPHAKLLIVGDYHKHDKVLAHNKQGKKMLVLSPGSIAMQSIDEERVKKFFVVFDDLSVKSVRLKTRPVIDCPPLTCEHDVDRFVGSIEADILVANARARAIGIPEGIRDPIVYVSYDVTVPDVYKRIARAMPKGTHLFRKEILPVDEEDDLSTAQREASLEMGLLGCLDKVVNRDEEPEVHGMCHALLSTDEPGAVLSGIRKEWIGDDDVELDEKAVKKEGPA